MENRSAVLTKKNGRPGNELSLTHTFYMNCSTTGVFEACLTAAA